MRARILVAALGTAALLATGPTAMAGKPLIQTFRSMKGDTIDCGGFTLEDHVFGTIRSRLTENADGSARDVVSIRLRHVVTNLQTGASLTVQRPSASTRCRSTPTAVPRSCRSG